MTLNAVCIVEKLILTVCDNEAKQSASAFCMAPVVAGLVSCRAQLIDLYDSWMAQLPTSPVAGRVALVRHPGRRLTSL